MSTSATRDERGRIDGAIALVSDLTEQLVAARRLAESEAARRAVVDALPDLLFLVSSDYVVLERHAGADHPPLLQSDLYVGHTVGELIPDRADQAEAAIDHTLRTGEVANFEFTFLVDDQVLAYEARCSRVAADQVMILVRDVTEVRAGERAARAMALEVQRRQAAEERADLERQLGRAARLEALGRLAAGVAHDMNNLLGVVGNYAAAIRGSSDEERTVLDALEIERAVRRGTELTRRLLLFGRRDGASVRVHDLRAVVSGVCSMLTRTLAPTHPLQVRFDAGQALAAVDRWQLEQAVINLVINAQDASGPGDPIVVSLVAEPSCGGDPLGPRWLRVSVTDRGPGMPPAVRERAFEPFFTTKGPERGSGLGLAVVHGMATEAGGRVEITCPPGGGTTVSIILPEAVGRPTGSVPPEAPLLAPPAARLLVVDDEEDARRSISRLLVARGYEVAEAESGDRALEVLAQVSDIDAVVTDVAMPGVSGPVLAGRIRTDFPDLPVVLVTGFGADLLDGVPADVQVLAKPLEVEQLVSTLSRLLAPA
jgi:signal transduction histidine kinase/CheY-like chemotaxis protein